jgi:hypothetical protein
MINGKMGGSQSLMFSRLRPDSFSKRQGKLLKKNSIFHFLPNFFLLTCLIFHEIFYISLPYLRLFITVFFNFLMASVISFPVNSHKHIKKNIYIYFQNSSSTTSSWSRNKTMEFHPRVVCTFFYS